VSGSLDRLEPSQPYLTNRGDWYRSQRRYSSMEPTGAALGGQATTRKSKQDPLGATGAGLGLPPGRLRYKLRKVKPAAQWDRAAGQSRLLICGSRHPCVWFGAHPGSHISLQSIQVRKCGRNSSHLGNFPCSFWFGARTSLRPGGGPKMAPSCSRLSQKYAKLSKTDRTLKIKVNKSVMPSIAKNWL
jgi:hypothetical protein